MEPNINNMVNNTPDSTQKPHITARFFFLSLGTIVALITTVTSAINLLFETLNFKFPDALNSVYQYGYNSYNYDSMRAALATLIIVLPILLVLSHFWHKHGRNISGKDLSVKKWMIYFILFLVSIMLVADLITLVRYFVSGEITNRFIYKVLGVLVVGGLVGKNYLYEMRADNRRAKGGAPVAEWYFKLFGIAAAVFATALIVWSFAIMGSPAKQRALRMDERRLQDLQTIQSQVINYWQVKSALPNELKDLTTSTSYFTLPVDPEFEKGKTYEYKNTGKLTFEICATFSEPIPKGWNEYKGGGGIVPMVARDTSVSSYPTEPAMYPYPGGGTNESWTHDAGYTCFARTIDKDLYPPYPKTK